MRLAGNESEALFRTAVAARSASPASKEPSAYSAKLIIDEISNSQPCSKAKTSAWCRAWGRDEAAGLLRMLAARCAISCCSVDEQRDNKYSASSGCDSLNHPHSVTSMMSA